MMLLRGDSKDEKEQKTKLVKAIISRTVSPETRPVRDFIDYDSFMRYRILQSIWFVLPVLPVSEVWNMGYSAPWTLLNNLFSSTGW
jgi:hypothetical protein